MTGFRDRAGAPPACGKPCKIPHHLCEIFCSQPVDY